MASVYKRGDRASGWTIEYRTATGERRRVAGGRTKAEATKLARELEQREGELGRRAKLNLPVLAEPQYTWPMPAARAAYRLHQLTKATPTSPRWADQVGRHIEAAELQCGWRVVGELSKLTAQRYLASLRQRGLGAAAVNRHRAALRGFSRWLASDEGANLPVDPLRDLRGMDERAEPRRARRALTEAEVAKLLEAAGASDWVTIPKRYRHKGKLQTQERRIMLPQRAMLYRLAMSTGMRAAELASLTRESFNLVDQPATVVVDAAYSKRGRRERILLRDDLVPELAELVGRSLARLELWPNLQRAGEIVRADCQAAGIETDGPQGRVDFHSLRHTFITRLARAGVHPKVAQQLARHSTVQLTLDVYTHATDAELLAALGTTPAIGAPAGG